jgi:hypothetical protein
MDLFRKAALESGQGQIKKNVKKFSFKGFKIWLFNFKDKLSLKLKSRYFLIFFKMLWIPKRCLKCKYNILTKRIIFHRQT